MRPGIVLFTALLGFIFSAKAESKPTNLVFILTDNHGAWTLGCYGNPDIRTPNLDRMAEEGLLFERALSSNPVCSPTRATFLTGLIPSQHGVHSFLDNKYMVGEEAYYTLEEFETLPEILHSEGYTCGLVGKWHLGPNLILLDGFSIWITMHCGGPGSLHTHPLSYNCVLHPSPQYLTDLWSER